MALGKAFLTAMELFIVEPSRTKEQFRPAYTHGCMLSFLPVGVETLCEAIGEEQALFT